MRIEKTMILWVITALFLLTLAPAAIASDIQVIDKSNWQQAQGLLPEKALDWVKRGDLTMHVGALDYDPTKCWPQWALESLTENVGKYDINENDEIVDAKTGNRPGFVNGFPFPKIEPNDPKAAVKAMYNGYYVRDVNGPFRVGFTFRFVGRDSGYERYVTASGHMFSLDGYGPARDGGNPDDIEIFTQIIVHEPYDMGGTSTMTWRYRSAKQDVLYGYIPAIRRVRRMTPAGRSDAMFGSDFARDDGGYPCYDGKMSDFTWKLLGKTEVLAGYLSIDPLRFYKNKRGEWAVDSRGKKLINNGYETEGWTGAPWFNTTTVWVKRPAWVIEMHSKDPYYNYGKQIVYIDAETYVGLWKEIWDRSGEYWKTQQNSWVNAWSDDKTYGTLLAGTFFILDERADHATIVDFSAEDYRDWIQEVKKMTVDQFSLGGFIKMCK